MPPIRQSERQRARAAAALAHPPHGDRVEPIGAPGSSAAPPAAPAAPRTATRLWEADEERRLEATEQLHHGMHVMREMLRVALQQVSPTNGHDAVAAASVDRQVATPYAVNPSSRPASFCRWSPGGDTICSDPIGSSDQLLPLVARWRHHLQ